MEARRAVRIVLELKPLVFPIQMGGKRKGSFSGSESQPLKKVKEEDFDLDSQFPGPKIFTKLLCLALSCQSVRYFPRLQQRFHLHNPQMSNPLRTQCIEEHGSVDAYFKSTLGTKDWSRVMLLSLHSVLSLALHIQFCQERVLKFLTWQEETFPADPSVHAPQNFTKRNGAEYGVMASRNRLLMA